jgi:predicted component of type VI protein secretion system
MKIEANSDCKRAADVIVADTCAALSAIDDALLAQAQLLTTTLQAAKSHPLRVGVTQRLYTSFGSGVQGILESRKAMADSITTLHAIARAQGVEERLEGCADGFPQSFTSPMGRVGTADAEVAG